jgi:hypothetical protein
MRQNSWIGDRATTSTRHDVMGIHDAIAISGRVRVALTALARNPTMIGALEKRAHQR